MSGLLCIIAWLALMVVCPPLGLLVLVIVLGHDAVVDERR
jgi:hypothetical protein